MLSLHCESFFSSFFYSLNGDVWSVLRSSVQLEQPCILIEMAICNSMSVSLNVHKQILKNKTKSFPSPSNWSSVVSVSSLSGSSVHRPDDVQGSLRVESAHMFKKATRVLIVFN